MNTKFEIVKKKFFSNEITFPSSKSYHIRVDNIIFYTAFIRKKLDLTISVELFGWSNTYQENTPLMLSSWVDDINEGKELNGILEKYSPLAQKFLKYLEEFRYAWEYKELFYQFEHPNIIYHYKFHNSFSCKELGRLSNIFDFSSSPILNTASFEANEGKLSYNELFLPYYFNSCFFFTDKACDSGIVEISTDLNESDYVVIENDAQRISKEELLSILASLDK
ncbi:MAG: hypothetical protein ACOC08_01920 [Campylobacterales bacterium]